MMRVIPGLIAKTEINLSIRSSKWLGCRCYTFVRRQDTTHSSWPILYVRLWQDGLTQRR